MGGCQCRARKKDDEFLAPDAGDDPLIPRTALEHGRKGGDDLVAGAVAMGVVDLLEAIEIGGDERGGRLAACGRARASATRASRPRRLRRPDSVSVSERAVMSAMASRRMTSSISKPLETRRMAPAACE